MGQGPGMSSDKPSGELGTLYAVLSNGRELTLPLFPGLRLNPVATFLSPHTSPSSHHLSGASAFASVGLLTQWRQLFWVWVEQRTHCQVKCCHWHLKLSLQRVLIRTALLVTSEVWVFPSSCWFHPAWGSLCASVTSLPASTHICLSKGS